MKICIDCQGGIVKKWVDSAFTDPVPVSAGFDMKEGHPIWNQRTTDFWTVPKGAPWRARKQILSKSQGKFGDPSRRLAQRARNFREDLDGFVRSSPGGAFFEALSHKACTRVLIPHCGAKKGSARAPAMAQIFSYYYIYEKICIDFPQNRLENVVTGVTK